MIQQIITFDGGLSTKRRPHLIQRNEGIVCENVDLEAGGLCPLADWEYEGNYTGKYLYRWNDSMISNLADTDERFYDTFGGRVYWTDRDYTTSGLRRYNATVTPDPNVGEDADSPDAPDAAPTNTLSNGQHNGRSSGDYVYCYTFVDDGGIESPPSPFMSVSIVDDDAINLTLPDTNAPADLAYRRIYRTGGANPTFNLIAEVAVGTTTYTDNTRDIDVSRIELYTFENYSAVDELDMLIECNGTMWGALGKNVYFSRTGSPEYWGLLDYVTLDKNVTGLGKFGNSVVAFTRTSAYFINGSTRDDIDVQRLPFNQGCINKYSIVNIDSYLLWTSLDGVCIFNGSTIDIITKRKLDWDEFGRVGELTFGDFDSTTTKWDSSLGFEITYAIGYRDKYYGVYSDGIVHIDLSDGIKIGTIRLEGVTTLMINDDDNILYGIKPNETSGYDAYFLPSGCDNRMTAVWQTGRLADETTDITKHYRYVEFDAVPDSVEVFIDGVSIKTYTSRQNFKLPAGSFGRDIQFKITTTNPIRSLKYEYTHMKASR